MSFGENLKKYRLKANLTQDQLASRVGVQKQNISRYENSDREPNIKTAKKLADALGITLEVLTYGDRTIKELHVAEKKADSLDVLPSVFAGWEAEPEDLSSVPTELVDELLWEIRQAGSQQDSVCRKLLDSLKHPALLLSTDERQLVEDYRELTPSGREYIRQTMALAKNAYSPAPEIRMAARGDRIDRLSGVPDPEEIESAISETLSENE
jgi:transcriptional regulator with XRE-family HTH domain